MTEDQYRKHYDTLVRNFATRELELAAVMAALSTHVRRTMQSLEQNHPVAAYRDLMSIDEVVLDTEDQFRLTADQLTRSLK